MKPALSLISGHTPGAVAMSAAGGHLVGTTVASASILLAPSPGLSTGMENGTVHSCDLRGLPGRLGTGTGLAVLSRVVMCSHMHQELCRMAEGR